MSWRKHRQPQKRMKRKMKDHTAYRKLYKEAIEQHKPQYIIGVDEVGWGAVVGDLGIGIAVYPANYANSKLKIRDSKKYGSAKAREKALEQVKHTAKYVKYLSVSSSELEVFGAQECLIGGLTKLVQEALVLFPNSLIVVDGDNTLKVDAPQLSLPKADDIVLAVSAASIMAKVSRDATLKDLDADFPEFAWRDNKGYPTQKHLQAIREHGVTIHHRRNVSIIPEMEVKYGKYEEKKK